MYFLVADDKEKVDCFEVVDSGWVNMGGIEFVEIVGEVGSIALDNDEFGVGYDVLGVYGFEDEGGDLGEVRFGGGAGAANY